ncbi:MAG: molybdenum cofactor guanylyltransferase [Oscillospiraceae bacterium]|nr:molybdenum cofactor guanylyltransferase [Oscillospiraceae bacterium]
MSTVVILAGGKSRRMGCDKLALPLNGGTLLESAVRRFGTAFEDVYISVADAAKYPEVDAQRVIDVFPGSGPLAGLHAALSSLPVDGVFLVAADLPFSSPEAALFIMGLCGDCEACVLRLPDGRLEPLFGFYRRSLLGRCEAALQAGDFKMTALLAEASTRFVEPGEIGELWDARMIMNLNYPEDYERIAR